MRISPASIIQICMKSNVQRLTSSGECMNTQLAGYAILQSGFARMGVPSAAIRPYHAFIARPQRPCPSEHNHDRHPHHQGRRRQLQLLCGASRKRRRQRAGDRCDAGDLRRQRRHPQHRRRLRRQRLYRRRPRSVLARRTGPVDVRRQPGRLGARFRAVQRLLLRRRRQRCRRRRSNRRCTAATPMPLSPTTAAPPKNMRRRASTSSARCSTTWPAKTNTSARRRKR
jgi:hypothetical protein